MKDARPADDRLLTDEAQWHAFVDDGRGACCACGDGIAHWKHSGYILSDAQVQDCIDGAVQNPIHDGYWGVLMGERRRLLGAIRIMSVALGRSVKLSSARERDLVALLKHALYLNGHGTEDDCPDCAAIRAELGAHP